MPIQEKFLRQLIVIMMAGGLLASTWHLAAAYENMEVQNGGSITGVVKLKGAAPPAAQLEITRDQKVCGSGTKSSEALVVSPQGGVKYAVVSLQNISQGKPQPEGKENPRLVQEKCWFNPHVVLVPAGSTLDLFNHDKTTHNIHTRSKANPIINSAHPSFRKRLRLKNKFKQPETIKAKCDMHAWMSAWFVVTDHPYYAVTDANGAFSLQDVPPGTYTLQVWHETLGQQTQQVTVAANGETPAEVEFSQ